MATTFVRLAEVEWNGHMNDGWWVVMIVGMVLFLVLAILGIVWLFRDLARSREATAEPDPLAILDRRLASGEVSPEEYSRIRATLRGEEP